MCSCQVSAERLKTCFTGPSSEQIRLLWVVRCLYSYFEKGCRKKYTRQSRKVLWVRIAREAIVVSLRVLKESNKSRFDSYSIRNSVLIISHITFRDSRVHFFPHNLSRNSCFPDVAGVV